ncbi:MAG: NUDIX hydrolase [Deltaproteobacteria bacterium]
MRILTNTLQKLTNLRWLNLFEVEYEHESGQRARWQFVSRKPAPVLTGAPTQPDAVFIVPILKTPQGNRLVVLKEFRVPLGGCEYTCPAGLLEPGETIETTVRRELAEETGLELTRIFAASPPVIASAGMSDESAVVVFVECSGTPSTAGLDGTEEIEVLVLDFEQLRALRRAPGKFSAKAWLVLLLFEALGEIAWPKTLDHPGQPSSSNPT